MIAPDNKNSPSPKGFSLYTGSSAGHPLWLRVWAGVLIAVLLAGLGAYLHQFEQGLRVTGLGQSMSWGLYIAQFTFLVGVGASAAVVVVPAAFGYRPFARAAVFGEFLAVAAVGMALLCVLADLGQPQRLLNLLLHPSPRSLMFWDMLTLTAYLALNLAVGRATLEAERLVLPPPRWVRPATVVAVILAVGIHTVTAFLYAGLPGRHHWLSAILAARFLASAFCSGPAALLLLLLGARLLTGYHAADEARPGLLRCILGALLLNSFFMGLEIFTALYSAIPAAEHPLALLFFSSGPAGLMWTGLMASALALLLLGRAVWKEGSHPVRLPELLAALGATMLAIWIDKGPGLMFGGFGPDPFGAPVAYSPSLTEGLVLAGIHAAGLLILTLLWARVITIRKNHLLFPGNSERSTG